MIILAEVIIEFDSGQGDYLNYKNLVRIYFPSARFGLVVEGVVATFHTLSYPLVPPDRLA